MGIKTIQVKTNVIPIGLDTKRHLPLYPANPFMNMSIHPETDEDGEIETGNRITASMANEKTTVIAQVKFLEKEQFIKLYTQNIKWMLGLSSAGFKVFVLLANQIQTKAINAGVVYFKWLNAEKTAKALEIQLSRSTFDRGVRDLCEKNVIALSEDPSLVFINPAIVFNGDRVDFVNSYRKLTADTTKALAQETKALPAPATSVNPIITHKQTWLEQAKQDARNQRTKVAL
jgi:hypothetical protein